MVCGRFFPIKSIWVCAKLVKSKQRVEPLLRIDWGCLDGFANITHCNLHFTVQVKGICTINITVYSTQGNATL